MSGARRVGIVAVAFACLATSVWLAIAWPRLTREPVGPPAAELTGEIEAGPTPVSGRFVGHTERDITERFGPPSHRRAGHYGAPPVDYQLKYSDAVTATYDRPSGMLYLSYCEQGGGSVCFRSDWMPVGWVF